MDLPYFNPPIDVLLTCHCAEPITVKDNKGKDKIHHPEVWFVDLITNTMIKDINKNYKQIGIKTLKYIDPDPKCHNHKLQYKSWDKIPSNSKDLVWIICCPLYHTLYHDLVTYHKLQQLDSFYWMVLFSRVLRPGGSIVIPKYGGEFEEMEPFEIEFADSVYVVEKLSMKEMCFSFYKQRGTRFFLIITKL